MGIWSVKSQNEKKKKKATEMYHKSVMCFPHSQLTQRPQNKSRIDCFYTFKSQHFQSKMSSENFFLSKTDEH